MEKEKREMEKAMGEASSIRSNLSALKGISAENMPSETMSNETSGKKLALPKVWYATTKAHKTHTEVSFSPNDYIVFGKESAGIPEEILVDNEEQCIRIPMLEEARSLNLSNSVAIILYEALRQQDFPFLSKEGALHHLQWKD